MYSSAQVTNHVQFCIYHKPCRLLHIPQTVYSSVRVTHLVQFCTGHTPCTIVYRSQTVQVVYRSHTLYSCTQVTNLVQLCAGHKPSTGLHRSLVFQRRLLITNLVWFSTGHRPSIDNNNNNNNRTDRRNSRFLQSPHCARTVSNMYAQVARSQSCANHVQHIERLSRAHVVICATWYERTAQLLSLTELKSHLFELYFIG